MLAKLKLATVFLGTVLHKRRLTMSDLMLDVGQANQLKLVLRKADWSSADVNALCTEEKLREILFVIRGTGEVIVEKHFIDCSADAPFMRYCAGGPKMHQKGDILEWDPEKIRLWKPKLHSSDQGIELEDLNSQLADKIVLNACVFGDLMKHTEFIPKSWKGLEVFFVGTIYPDPNPVLNGAGIVARGIHYTDGQWGETRLNLGRNDLLGVPIAHIFWRDDMFVATLE